MGLFSSTKASRAKKTATDTATSSKKGLVGNVSGLKGKGTAKAVASPALAMTSLVNDKLAGHTSSASVVNLVSRTAGLRAAPTGALSGTGDALYEELANIEREVMAESLCNTLVAKEVCLAPAWFRYTAMGRQARRAQQLLRESPALARLASDAKEFKRLAREIGIFAEL